MDSAATVQPEALGFGAEVQGDEETFVPVLAVIGEHVTVGLDRGVGTHREGGLGAPQKEEPAVNVEHGTRVVSLGFDVVGHVVSGHGELETGQKRT